MGIQARLRLLCGLGFIVLLSFTACGQVSVSELSQEWVVKPGQIYQGVIEIVNTGEEPSPVEIYQTDYLFNCDGQKEYGLPGELPHSNADWVTFELTFSRLTIPAKNSITVPYTITVPDDLELVGTYWSMVHVGLPVAEAPTASENVVIRQRFEYGIQIVTDIGDIGEREVHILDAKLLYEGEGAILKIDLENTGERWVRPEAWAELYDENGAVVGRFESPRQRIYPGCSVRHRFLLVGIPGGKYKALVIFDNGDEYVWGAQYDLEL